MGAGYGLRWRAIQLTPPNWHTPFHKDGLIPCTGSSTNLKPTYTSLPSSNSWSLTPYLTHSSSALKKLGIPNHVVFATNSDVLNHVSAFSRQDNSMYQITWPHSTNQLQFHSTKGHLHTLCGSKMQPFNSQVLAIFPPSATAPATH